jgi:hypothetical protein
MVAILQIRVESQCMDFFGEPADFFLVLLPFDGSFVGVGVISVQFHDAVDHFDVKLAGLAEEGFHDGAVPGG